MYNLYPSMKYRPGSLDIIQPSVEKQLKESYARTQHLEGRTKNLVKDPKRLKTNHYFFNH